MSRLIRRLYLFIFGMFVGVPAESTTVQIKRQAVDTTRTSMADDSGEFYFREAILDQLNYYLKCIGRMKRADPDAFALYSSLGAHVVPEKSLKWFMHVGAFDEDQREVPTFTPELSPWFKKTLPSFGAIFIGKAARDVEDTQKSYIPRFYYFRRYDRLLAPPSIQRPQKGAVYVATVYWDNLERRGKWKYKGAIPQDYPLVVLPDGKVQLLRHLEEDRAQIRHKHGRDRGRTFTIPRRTWVTADPWFDLLAKEHNTRAEEFLTALFIKTANMYEAANSSIVKIMASRNGVTATFGVDVKRMPYFFKDRQIYLNENGERRRVFHIVRAHVRKNGGAVPFHFRGQKEFDWNGYKINISVPGKDSLSLAEFNVVGIDDAQAKPSQKTIGMKEIAVQWKNHITAGSALFGYDR